MTQEVEGISVGHEADLQVGENEGGVDVVGSGDHGVRQCVAHQARPLRITYAHEGAGAIKTAAKHTRLVGTVVRCWNTRSIAAGGAWFDKLVGSADRRAACCSQDIRRRMCFDVHRYRCRHQMRF